MINQTNRITWTYWKRSRHEFTKSPVWRIHCIDLDGKDLISRLHLGEALSYRQKPAGLRQAA